VSTLKKSKMINSKVRAAPVMSAAKNRHLRAGDTLVLSKWEGQSAVKLGTWAKRNSMSKHGTC